MTQYKVAASYYYVLHIYGYMYITFQYISGVMFGCSEDESEEESEDG